MTTTHGGPTPGPSYEDDMRSAAVHLRRRAERARESAGRRVVVISPQLAERVAGMLEYGADEAERVARREDASP